MLYFPIRTGLLWLFTFATLSAADITGLWAGQAAGRGGELEDVAFQFKVKGTVLTGKLFGDEFDLPLEAGSLIEDRLKFAVTMTNYYSGDKVQVLYAGSVNGNEIELTRERVAPAGEKKAKEGKAEMKADVKPKPFTIRRLARSASSEER